MQVIAMSNVGVRRGEAWLLKDVNWVVDEADRWVVVGPNGAGKTTALTIAATRMFPTTGEVSILGRHRSTAKGRFRQQFFAP